MQIPPTIRALLLPGKVNWSVSSASPTETVTICKALIGCLSAKQKYSCAPAMTSVNNTGSWYDTLEGHLSCGAITMNLFRCKSSQLDIIICFLSASHPSLQNWPEKSKLVCLFFLFPSLLLKKTTNTLQFFAQLSSWPFLFDASS